MVQAHGTNAVVLMSRWTNQHVDDSKREHQVS